MLSFSRGELAKINMISFITSPIKAVGMKRYCDLEVSIQPRSQQAKKLKLRGACHKHISFSFTGRLLA